jgi:DNA replication initiation complex subunit (GINS family)
VSQPITPEVLFSKLQNEKATGELLTLQKDFYSLVGALIAELESVTTEEKKRQCENIKKMLFALKERRKQKVLMYLAYNKRMPQPIPEEEEVLYNEINKVLNKDASSIRISRLKIISTIPEVLTANGRKIGPFKQGEVVEISNSNDAEFILNNKIGEVITQ